MKNKKDKLVAVDLDGTLIDTLRVNAESYRIALQGEGCTFSDEEFAEKCFGRYYLEFVPALLGGNPGREKIEYIHERKKQVYSSCVSFGKRNDALYEILKALKATGEWYTALVTTGSARNAEEILKTFDCYDFFDLIITSSDVTNNKPDPEGYLMAMKKFQIAPENTVIFEDSETGIAAAEASGAKVFLIDRF